ncbi:MAG: divergent polysaccharide deacetylase family protein [Halofilum sp. (in: g-proteobacteria)]|nr:divergent polysaccharide deacetylase family protein [Halofilum sp. (in: g-proteobacteria)]
MAVWRWGTLPLLLALGIGQAAAAPTAALIIDDLGHNRESARRALALPPPFAVAILPHAPYTGTIARAAARAGSDILVHMPMEAERGPPAPHALLAEMDDATLRARLGRAVESVPGAVGVNNHQGSGLTARASAMALVMRELAQRSPPLLFIDSRTTAATEAETAAREAGIAVARRHVFLDHRKGTDAIERATEAWLERARETGCALAIAHPRPDTMRVLERKLPRAQGVERVDLATYIERCGTPATGDGKWRVSSSRSRPAARNSKPSP